jgi:hypothetical protein
MLGARVILDRAGDAVPGDLLIDPDGAPIGRVIRIDADGLRVKFSSRKWTFRPPYFKPENGDIEIGGVVRSACGLKDGCRRVRFLREISSCQ